MIFNYKECIQKYVSDYQIKKELESKRLYKIDKGLYSDTNKVSKKQIISYLYPDAVYTSKSAFYYHKLSDVIPDYNYLVVKRDNTRIKDKEIKQSYILDTLFDIGRTELVINDVNIMIYDKERMLIELIRLKSKYSYDYYKEVIRNYREIINELDLYKLQKYASKFKNGKKIMEVINKEVL